MKILRVISSMEPSRGGPCQGIRNSIPELNKLGIENEVVCLDGPESLYLKTDFFINHTLGPATNFWSYSSKLLPWMLNNLLRFDVIIVHGLWSYTLPKLVIARPETGSRYHSMLTLSTKL